MAFQATGSADVRASPMRDVRRSVYAGLELLRSPASGYSRSMSIDPTRRETRSPWAAALIVAVATYVVLTFVLILASNIGPVELGVLFAVSALAGAVRLSRR